MRALKERLGRFIRYQVHQAMAQAAHDGEQPMARQANLTEALETLGLRLHSMEVELRAILPQAQVTHALAADWRRMRPACYLGDGRALTVTSRGDRMYVDGRDIMISPSILCWGGWEEGTVALLDRFLKPGMVWADVGANCGYFTVIGHKLVRAGGQPGETHAFEISPDNVQLCVDNLALSWMPDGSHVEHKAIYSEETSLTFQIFTKYSVNSGISGIGEQHATYAGEKQRSVEVRATTLDSYFLSRARRPDFIKIDVEGGEWHALRGARGLIAAQPDLQLLIEWSPDQLTACGTEPRALAEIIPALGLKCFNAENDMAPLTIEDCLAIQRTTMFLLSRSAPDNAVPAGP
jgi:FkbM family methyltransferase